MGFAENYLRKQSSFKPSIQIQPQADLAYIIVIPATKEKDLMHAIRSIYFCTPVKNSFEIITCPSQLSNFYHSLRFGYDVLQMRFKKNLLLENQEQVQGEK